MSTPSPLTNSTSAFPGVTSLDAKLLTSLLIDLCLFGILMAFFLFFKKRVPRVYEARCFDSLSPVAPPQFGLLGWIRSAFEHDDVWLLKNRGLDAVVYLTVVQTLLLILVPCTVVGLVVLMPIYAVAGRNNLAGLESVTLGNLGEGDSYVWAAFTMVWVYSFWAIYCLYRCFYKITGLRIYYRALRRVENYVVLVREIPRNLSAKDVAAHFETILPGQIVSINVALKSRRLPQLFKERKNAICQLEKFWAIFYETNGERKRIYAKCCPWNYLLPQIFSCCATVHAEDAIDYWTARVRELDVRIEEKQQKSRSGAGVAFVTFRSIRSAQMMWQSELHSGNFRRNEHEIIDIFPRPWISEPPAPPESMKFKNLAVSGRSRFWRLVIVNILNVALVALFYVPVAVLVAISNAEEINSIPIIGELVLTIPAVEGLVRGFLPSLGLAVINVLQLLVLRVLVARIGYLDYASNHKSVLGRFFLFFIFNNLIGITVGGAIIDVFQFLLVQGSTFSALELIAAAIPRQAGFFQNYLLILGLAGNAFFLSKPLLVIWRAVRLRWFAHSRRQKRQMDGPFRFAFEGAIWPLVVFLFGMVYSVISPIILVFASFYMAFAYVRGKHDFTYHYTAHHPSNGYIFPTFYTCTMWSVILFQGLTMLVLLLQGSYWAFFILLIICFAILVFILVQLKFSNLAKHGTLSQKPEAEGQICPPDCYVQPFFLPPTMKEENQDPTMPYEKHDARDRTFAAWESVTLPVLPKHDKPMFKEAEEDDEEKKLDPLRATAVITKTDGLIEDFGPSERPSKQKRISKRESKRVEYLPLSGGTGTGGSRTPVMRRRQALSADASEETSSETTGSLVAGNNLSPRPRKLTSFFVVNRSATASEMTTDFEDYSSKKARTHHRRGGSYFGPLTMPGLDVEMDSAVEEMEPVSSTNSAQPSPRIPPVPTISVVEMEEEAVEFPEDEIDDTTEFDAADIDKFMEEML